MNITVVSTRSPTKTLWRRAFGCCLQKNSYLSILSTQNNNAISTNTTSTTTLNKNVRTKDVNQRFSATVSTAVQYGSHQQQQQYQQQYDDWTRWSAIAAFGGLVGAYAYTNKSLIVQGINNKLLEHNNNNTHNTQIHNDCCLQSIQDGNYINKNYTIEWNTILGRGASGTVHPATCRATGEKVAIKKINRTTMSSTIAELCFQTEMDAFAHLYNNSNNNRGSNYHPNIGKLHNIYQDEKHYYFVLDLINGGEMYDDIVNHGAYNERDAARLISQLGSALHFLHTAGIVHMDLKPENLLLSTKNRETGTIKMIDFGSAYIADDSCSTRNRNVATPSSGTIAYWAPERFDNNNDNNNNKNTNQNEPTSITPAMDMWSVGLILYIMLTGCHPFDINGNLSDDEVGQKIQQNPKPPLNNDLVGHLSESAIDLILRLMEVDPTKRISAADMLQHPWIVGQGKKTQLRQ